MKDIRIDLTTDVSGNAAVTHGSAVFGILYAIDYLPGTLATGATVTVTDENGSVSHTLYVKASAGTSNFRKYPRILETLNTDGSDLVTYAMPLVAGRPKVVIASGGNVGSGAVVLYFL